jgi:hypothetical protein
MSEPETEITQPQMPTELELDDGTILQLVDTRDPQVWDDPNRQALGLDPVWVEGTGGEPGETAVVEETQETEEVDLDSMTKDELLAHAQALGVSPANASMTKDELRAGIEEHQAG